MSADAPMSPSVRLQSVLSLSMDLPKIDGPFHLFQTPRLGER